MAIDPNKKRGNQPSQEVTLPSNRPIKRIKTTQEEPNKTSVAKRNTAIVQSFAIQCQGGKTVQISEQQAICLRNKCAFFRNAFRHGTIESSEGVLTKHDWSEETAHHLIELLTSSSGKTKLPTDFFGIAKAADQILLPLLFRHPLTRKNIVHDINMVQLLSKRWSGRNSEFTFETNSAGSMLTNGPNPEKKWQELFSCGVILLRDADEPVLECLGGPKDAPGRTQSNLFKVGAATPLCVSVFHTCTYLSDTVSTTSPSTPYGNAGGRYELIFPANFGSGLFLKKTIGKNTVNYFKQKNKELVLITGARPQDLKESLDAAEHLIIPNDDVKLCMLRVINPNSWTLGQFIFASQNCVENPATLAWTLEERNFYGVKTMADIRIMLDVLSAEESKDKVATKGPFHLKEHSAGCGWKAF